LRDAGFAGSGQDFHRRIGRNWATVNFQRDRYSTADALRFTVNIATASAAVIAAGYEDPELPPREVTCHWRARIGVLSWLHQDLWWTVSRDADEQALAKLDREVGGLLFDRAMAELERMADDRAILASAVGSQPYGALAPADLDIVGPLVRELEPERLNAYLSVIDAMTPPLGMYEVWEAFPPRMGAARTAKALAKLHSKSFEPRSVALHQLAFAEPTREVVDAVLSALNDSDQWIRYAAAFAAGHVGDARAALPLVALIATSPRGTACSAALGALRLARRTGIDGATMRTAVARRHDDAVGHDRPLLGYVLRELEGAISA
jgi:hypothetical protein